MLKNMDVVSIDQITPAQPGTWAVIIETIEPDNELYDELDGYVIRLRKVDLWCLTTLKSRRNPPETYQKVLGMGHCGVTGSSDHCGDFAPTPMRAAFIEDDPLAGYIHVPPGQGVREAAAKYIYKIRGGWQVPLKRLEVD